MRVVAVASGKGGVGKSTVAFLLAQALGESGKVLVLDFDLCGPSIGVLAEDNGTPVFMGRTGGLLPLDYSDRVSYLSISSLVPKETAVIWRAPKKVSLLSLFLNSIDFMVYEYVVIDMPPGVTDEHVFLCDRLPDALIVMVTTSQNLALEEAESSIRMFQERNMPVLGVIENMSTLCCPQCSAKTALFSTKGGELLAQETGTKYLGALEFIHDIDRIWKAEKDPNAFQGHEGERHIENLNRRRLMFNESSGSLEDAPKCENPSIPPTIRKTKNEVLAYPQTRCRFAPNTRKSHYNTPSSLEEQ